MALMITACSSNDIEQTAPQPSNRAEGIPFTATISIGESATTRALSEDATNNKIVTTWAAGEKVALIHNDVIDVVEVQSVSDGLATITGTLTGSPANNDPVTIIYPSSAADGTTGNVKSDLLAAQDGTLATIAEKYDVRKGAGTLNVGATATLYGNVSLTNQFAIFKFTTKNYDASADINVSPLTITIGTQDYTITPTSPTNVIYAVLPAVSSQTVSFSGTVGSMPYVYSKADVLFDAGRYYQSMLTMLPEGAIAAKFTINASGDKVYFSQGNLQAVIASGPTDTYNYTASSWKFAENQWDYIGNAAGNTSFAVGSTVDLFGWVGTSASYNTYGLCTQSSSNNDYYGTKKGSEGETLKSEWGTLPITNGGNAANSGWRTLKGGNDSEWKYLLSDRTTGGTVFGTAAARYAHAVINTDAFGVRGLILFPDGVDIASSEVTTPGTVNAISDYATKCTSVQWTALEAKGCVFLPAAGYRLGASVSYAGEEGDYWSSSPDDSFVYGASCVYFDFSHLKPAAAEGGYRYCGFSVRLVRAAE